MDIFKRMLSAPLFTPSIWKEEPQSVFIVAVVCDPISFMLHNVFNVSSLGLGGICNKCKITSGLISRG